MNKNFILVGKILKTKGFDGTVLVEFYYPIIQANFKALFIQKGNLYSPLLIEKLSIKDELTMEIKWAHYSSKELAQQLNNQEVFLDETLAENYFDLSATDDLIGYELYNEEKLIGHITEIYENNFQEIIEVELENNKKLLIPLIDEYIITIDDDKQIVYCSLDEEYINLFSN